METIETVTAFLARVEAEMRTHGYRRGQAAYHMMGCSGFTKQQGKFLSAITDGPLDPFRDDSRVDAFIAAAVAAGVLREDHA
jgi:hypothetical protein